MTVTRYLSLIVSLVSLLASANLQGQSDVPTQAYLDQFQIVRDWWGTSSIDASQDHVKYVTLGDKHLYVQSVQGTLSAFDIEKKRRVWVSQIGSPTATNSRIVEMGEQLDLGGKDKEQVLLVCSGMNLFAIQAKDGNVRWKASLGFAASASPSGSGNMLYFPTNSGTLYAIDIAKLEEIHKKGNLETEAPLAIKWKFITSNPINISPVATDLYVSFVGADGTVYSVAAANHELRFRFSAGVPLAAPLGITSDAFIVMAENYHLYNIRQDTGQVRWEFVTGPQIRKRPQVVGDSVFIAPEHGSLFCITLSGGKMVWESSGTSGFIAANNHRVYAYDDLNNLVLLDRETGKKLHHVGLQQYSFSVANERTDRAYLVTPQGLVLALRDADLVEPLVHPSLAPQIQSKTAGNGTP